MSTSGYIYLLHVYQSNSELVYKLGKTKREFHKRFQDYITAKPKIICVNQCDNCDIAEKNLLYIFKKNFTERKDIGNEYFQGDIKRMQNMFLRYFINEDFLFNYPETKICCGNRSVSNSNNLDSRSVSTSGKIKKPLSPFEWYYYKNRDNLKTNKNTYQTIKILLRSEWGKLSDNDKKQYEEYSKEYRINYKNNFSSIPE